jgi:hypothetical protein
MEDFVKRVAKSRPFCILAVRTAVAEKPLNSDFAKNLFLLGLKPDS